MGRHFKGPFNVLGNYINEQIKDPHLHRLLAWNGRIKVGSDDERVIESYFVESLTTKFGIPFNIKNYKKDSFFVPEIKVSLIPFLKMGSAWGPNGEYKISEVLFNSFELNLVKPRSSNPVKFYELPEFKELNKELRFPPSAPKSFVLAYDNVSSKSPGTKSGIIYHRVIIPCFEIARFYYFNSSTLTWLLLTPGSLDDSNNLLFVPSTDIIPVEGGQVTSNPKITVRVLQKSDLLTVSRIAFSKEARNAVSLMQESVLNEEKNYGYIKSHFPFSTDSKIYVRGIHVDTKSGPVLVVTEIYACRGHFPFTELDYSYDIPIRQNGTVKKKPKAGNKKPGRPKKPKMSPLKPTHGGGVLRLASLFRKRFLGVPHPDLIRYKESTKKTGDPKRDPKGGKPGVYLPRGISDSKHQKGDGKGHRPRLEALNIDDQKVLDKLKLDRFGNFEKIIKWFEEKSFNVSLIPIDEGEGVEDSSLTAYPISMDQYKYKVWCYLLDGTARGLIIAQIEFENNYYYLFEHQTRHAGEKIGLRVLYGKRKESHNHPEISRENIENIMLSFASNKGGVKNLRGSYNIESFPHIVGQSVDYLCNRILEKIGYKKFD